MFAITI